MNIQELIRNGANVSVTISANDLSEFASTIAVQMRKEFESNLMREKEERYIPAKEVAALLGVDTSTLWRWKKSGYLVPLEIGGKRRYLLSDVNRILKK